MNTRLRRHFVSMEAQIQQNVPTTLSVEATNAISSLLNPIVADLIAFYVKLKGFHWHISGSQFVQNHELIEEYATQTLDSIDVFAERVRKMGANTISSIGHVSSLQKLKENDDPSLSANEIFELLIEDNNYLIEKMREIRGVCDEHGDTATSAIIDTFIDEVEKRVWFLNQLMSEAS